MAAKQKSPDAFRTISEVAGWLETPAHVLRFWESRFPEISPVKGAGGRRYYRPEDMRLLGGIKRLLHEEGHTIKAVQDQLGSDGVASVAAHSPDLPSADRIAAGSEPAPNPAPPPPPIEAAADSGRPPIGYYFDDTVEGTVAAPAIAAPPPVETAPEGSSDPATLVLEAPVVPSLGRIDDIAPDPGDPSPSVVLAIGPSLSAELRGIDGSAFGHGMSRADLGPIAARLRDLRDRFR